MPKGSGFPVASKILKRSDQDRAFKLHRQKIQGMRAGLDNSPPRRHPHLVLRLKQTQLEEEHLANVDYQNKMLLHKMMKILQRPKNGVDNWNDYEARSLNQPYKTRVSRKIEQENLAIAKRLESVRPIYKIDKWEEDHKRHKYLLDLWADETKDFTPRKSRDGSVRDPKEDQYEDDFDSEEGEYERKREKLPEIKQEKEKGSRHSRRDSGVQKLPKIRPERKDGKPGQAELDAKQLFRVAKTLAPPTDVIIRTLIRRTPKQREMTKKKFRELYDLDMTSELKNGLGKEWHVLIDALLPESESSQGKDGDGAQKGGDGGGGGDEDALQAALQNGDIPKAVTIISSKNDKQLSELKEAYRKEHSIALESDIEEKTRDPEQLFLLTLLKEKNQGKKSGVQQDATALYEQGDGRWSSPTGEFMRLLESCPNGHTRAVLKKYEQVSGGTSARKAIEQECSKEYAQAVAAFMSSKGSEKGGNEAGGGGGEDSTAHAIVMYKNLNAENPNFVNLLVERAEVDMPSVRKAYKKKYKSELHTDLEERSRHPTVRCLVELILKTPQGKGKGQDNQGERRGQTKQGDQHPGQKKGQTGGQGQGKGQGQGQNKDNPLAQSSKKTTTDGKKDDGKQKKKGGADAKAAEDAERLHKAMSGMGVTHEDTVLEIIIKRNNAQRQTLKKKYKEKYKRDLAEHLQSELTGDFEELILGLLMPPVEYDAFCLHKAVDGLGTNEDVLIGILCTANPKELSSVKEVYKKTYGEDLDSAIKGDTSGGFEDLLLALSRGDRDQGTSVNEKEAKQDAQKLCPDKNQKLDMDSETFQTLMTKKNKQQMKATFAEYEKLRGKSMLDAIKESSSGDEEDGYVGLLGAVDDPVTFYADSLQKAFKGAGTNDDQVMRIVISRSEVDLPAIKAKFQERHGRSLRAAIQDETSGDYRNALIKLVDKK